MPLDAVGHPVGTPARRRAERVRVAQTSYRHANRLTESNPPDRGMAALTAEIICHTSPQGYGP